MPSKLTDLELTKLCADLRGIQYSVQKDRPAYGGDEYVRIEAYPGDANGGCYQPLFNDLQAMDLVKAVMLDIEPQGPDWWMVSLWTDDARRVCVTYDESLNRAIVGAAAKLQQARVKRAEWLNEPIKQFDYRMDPVNQPENMR